MGVTAIRTALGVLLAFAFISWIISLIGLAGLQRQCYNLAPLSTGFGGGGAGLSTGGEALEPLAGALPHIGLRGFNRSYGCHSIYRYYWFMFAFQIITLLGLTIMAAVGLLAASGLSWMSWLTVLTLLHIQGTDSFLALKDVGGLYGENYSYARLTSVGWILTAVTNLGLIFLLGWRPRKIRSGAGGPMKY